MQLITIESPTPSFDLGAAEEGGAAQALLLVAVVGLGVTAYWWVTEREPGGKRYRQRRRR